MGWYDHRGNCSKMEPVKEEPKEIPLDNLPEYPVLDINHSRRIYNNGDYKDNGVAKEHLLDHIEYNKKMRFGTALFINGVCVNYGYLGKERCAKISEEIIKANVKVMLTPTPYD